MFFIEKAITGNEAKNINTTEPVSALIDFYHAFNSRDLELMSNNWEQSDEASMSNPLGDIKRGWDAIKEVYSSLFHGNARVYVEFYNYTIHHSGEMFFAVGRERGYFQLGEQKINLAIRTSRTYHQTCGRWHQIHHHGSIENPELLAAYQKAVFSQKI